MRIFDPLRVFRTHRSFFPTLRHHLGSSAGQTPSACPQSGIQGPAPEGPHGGSGLPFPEQKFCTGPWTATGKGSISLHPVWELGLQTTAQGGVCPSCPQGSAAPTQLLEFEAQPPPHHPALWPLSGHPSLCGMLSPGAPAAGPVLCYFRLFYFQPRFPFCYHWDGNGPLHLRPTIPRFRLLK